MDRQTVIINGEKIHIPSCYQQVESMPDDPAGSIPFMTQTSNATCFAIVTAVDYSNSLPRTQDELVNGIRGFLADNQGFIKVETGDDYVYSIIKNLKEPSGVEYIMTYQRFCDDFIINVQAFFDEAGMTGIRDSMVFSIIKSEDPIQSVEDIFSGWTQDPYDESVTDGALMNQSEQEKYDEMFPEHPLSMCREFVKCIIEE